MGIVKKPVARHMWKFGSASCLRNSNFPIFNFDRIAHYLLGGGIKHELRRLTHVADRVTAICCMREMSSFD